MKAIQKRHFPNPFSPLLPQHQVSSVSCTCAPLDAQPAFPYTFDIPSVAKRPAAPVARSPRCEAKFARPGDAAPRSAAAAGPAPSTRIPLHVRLRQISRELHRLVAPVERYAATAAERYTVTAACVSTGTFRTGPFLFLFPFFCTSFPALYLVPGATNLVLLQPCWVLGELVQACCCTISQLRMGV